MKSSIFADTKNYQKFKLKVLSFKTKLEDTTRPN